MNSFFIKLMMMFTMMKVILSLIRGGPKPNPYGRNANGHYKIIYYENNCPN